MRKIVLRLVMTAAACLIGSLALAGEQITYFHNDVLGSPIAATDQKGYVMWRATYEPYGERIQSTIDAIVAMDVERWYASHVQDDETGLLYMQARYMDPQLGRFLSIDPAEIDGERPATFNRYAYGANNPYRYVDPDGRDFWAWLDKFSNPFSNWLPSDQSFQVGTRQLLGNSGYGDPGHDVVVNYTASNFRSVAQATAKVGDLWYNATLMGLGLEGEVGAARVAQAARATAQAMPTLQRIHSVETLTKGAARYDYEGIRKLSTNDIVKSLRPGSSNPLTVKPDGRIFEGNTRTLVLEERGFDINSLPRVILGD